MDLQAALFQRQGIEHTCHTMRDGLTGDVIDIQACQQNTDSRENQIQQVALLNTETAGKETGDDVDKRLEQDCSQARGNTDDEGENDDKRLFRQVLFTPYEKAYPPAVVFTGRSRIGT